MKQNQFLFWLMVFLLPSIRAFSQSLDQAPFPYSSITKLNLSQLVDSIENSELRDKTKGKIIQYLTYQEELVSNIEKPGLVVILSASTQFFSKDNVITLSFSTCCEQEIFPVDTVEITRIAEDEDGTQGFKREYIGVYNKKKASIVANLDIYSTKTGAQQSILINVGEAILVEIIQSYLKK